MNQFTKLSVRGFRRLQRLDLELRPLNVLIGANGCGKTSLLDCFNLLAASAKRGLNQFLGELGGITSVLTVGKSSQLSFGLSLDVTGRSRLEYRLRLSQKVPTYEINEEELQEIQTQSGNSVTLFKKSGDGRIEYLDQRIGKPAVLGLHGAQVESGLDAVSDPDRVPITFRDHLVSCSYFRPFNVDRGAPIRTPQQLRPVTSPGRNGEDLFSCLYYLRESHRDRFEAIEDAVRAAFPTFNGMELLPVAAGVIAMTWKDSQFLQPLYMNQLSEGTLRFLWLVTLLQMPATTKLTLLDEPETSLHPELLSLLAGLLREASQRTQLIVATQSDALVRFLRPEEVVAMDLNEEGAVETRRADDFDIAEWMQEYTLDEVWRLGRIGGRTGGRQ